MSTDLREAEEKLEVAEEYTYGAMKGRTGSLKAVVIWLLSAVKLIIQHLRKQQEADNDHDV